VVAFRLSSRAISLALSSTGDAMAKDWIKGAIGKPGALHKALKVPGDKKIPAAKLAKAAKAPGKLGKQARLAQTLRSFKK